MRNVLGLLLSIGAVACAVPGLPPDIERVDEAARPGFLADNVRVEVERDVGRRLGADAVRRLAAAGSSIMVTHHEGLPRPPVRQPDGSWAFEGPGANAVVRGERGWTGWAARETRPVLAARAAEIDGILADPAFWREPDHVAPTCTDAGARRLVVRHTGRIAVRQQSCGGVGLTGRLWELVFGGPG